jgi:hypothetical protein
MVAYRGPRDGHDAWQGDAYHQFLIEATADHIGHPKHLAHELAEMNKEELRLGCDQPGLFPREYIRRPWSIRRLSIGLILAIRKL